MAVAYEGKTVKQFLMDVARGRLAEMEKRGILPKGEANLGWDLKGIVLEQSVPGNAKM